MNHIIALTLTLTVFTLSVSQPVIYPVVLTLSIPTETPNTERVDNALFRWLTAGGVDLISIHTWTPSSEIDTLLQNATAVVFMGNPSQPDATSPYYIQAKYIYDTIKHSTHIIPILALGNDLAMLMSFEATTNTLSITNVKQHSPNSIVFESFDDVSKYNILSELDGADYVNLVSSDICPNQLEYVISRDEFMKHETLNTMYHLVAFARTSNNDVTYVAIVEGKEYPFYGLSFHPEKINFDKGYQVPVPDSHEAVKMARMIGNSFLFHARTTNNNVMSKEMKVSYDWIDPYGAFPQEWYGTYQYFFKNE
jgi:anthranilate/para-aminobenzoate synthase component II